MRVKGSSLKVKNTTIREAGLGFADGRWWEGAERDKRMDIIMVKMITTKNLGDLGHSADFVIVRYAVRHSQQL